MYSLYKYKIYVNVQSSTVYAKCTILGAFCTIDIVLCNSSAVALLYRGCD